MPSQGPQLRWIPKGVAENSPVILIYIVIIPTEQMAVDLEDGREAGEDNAIPHELMQFLRGDSFSLLIKGAAGTGKTTLALTILRVLKIRKNFLYLSTRSAPVQFVQYHPWLFELFRSGKIKAKRPIDPASIPMAFVDARLDEPTPLFERITNQLMDARSPLIVVDTWDSIEEFAEGKSLQTNMRVLQTWCERARAKADPDGRGPRRQKIRRARGWSSDAEAERLEQED